MALSARALEFSKPDPSFMFWDIVRNIWDPVTNPNGFVNLGLAENYMMHDVLREHIQTNLSVTNHDFTYGDGKRRLRNVLSRFFNKYFIPAVLIEPEHLTITNGCSSALEHLAWGLGNPGDCFLLGRPYYYTFIADITYRMSTKLHMVDFEDLDPFHIDAVARYERQIVECQERGQKVAGIILTNPHNPLGRCYSLEFKTRLMRVCQKYQVHLISDEIYALSTFSEHLNNVEDGNDFQSVLSIDMKGVIDPALVHVVWGTSKDFGANGIRLGMIISQSNSKLHASLVPVSLYSSSSSLTDHIVANFLEDEAWVQSYITANRAALARNHERVVQWAEEHRIPYAKGTNATFFQWLNLGSVRQNENASLVDVEQGIMDALLRNKVFLTSGAQFGSEQPGWFRIVVSQQPRDLDEGLSRILSALKE